MSLLTLPLELRQQIAGSLEPTSLRSFSLTSIACHQASLPAVFRQIYITVSNPEGLLRDVNALREALSYADSFSYIRQITIKGALSLAGKEKTDDLLPNQRPWSVTYSPSFNPLLDETPIFYGSSYVVCDESVIEASSDEDIAWAPLVNLLGAKISLENLVFDCRSQFPPSLLRVLHQAQPQCRLHHLTFKFRTLLLATPNAYEMELATSPCLYQLKAFCTQRDSNGAEDFNLEALMQLVTGLAPNLRKVEVLNLFPSSSSRWSRPRKSWQGFPGFTSRKTELLESLSLKGNMQSIWLNLPQVLQAWARHVDLASLQHLTLGGDLYMLQPGVNGDSMEWIVQNQSFPRLRSLCARLSRDDSQVERPRYREQAISFIRSFESLQQLYIDGSIDYQITNTVLTCHGQTLRKLSLHPFEKQSASNSRRSQDLPFYFTKNCVLRLRAQCPILEELVILVKRNMSRPSETELYKCFGEIRRLRVLSLILDCSNWRVTRDPTYKPEFNKHDREPLPGQSRIKRGDLKEAFINCAVDQALACSIWTTISQNKTGTPLERLKLWPTGAGEYGDQEIDVAVNEVVRNLSRSWSVERTGRNDKEDFTVTELQRERRLVLEERYALLLPSRHNHWIWEIFHSIWPSREGSKDFRDNWSSFPLQ
jgi:hypothetical protein